MMRKNETERRFRVAFSYASENRDLVGRAAILIAELFGETAVLYDKFHEGEFARDDLASHLPRLYQEESSLIVVVIGPDYQMKKWTGLEWDAIRGVIQGRQERDTNEVMLCRFNGVTPEGLDSEPGPGFVEMDEKTPGQFAKVILQRLAANEKKKLDHYLHRLYVRWSRYWLAIGIVVPLLALALYPVSMRAWSILLSAVLMGTMGVVVNFTATRFERVAPVFWKVFVALALACAALFGTYREMVVRVDETHANGSSKQFAYVTGSTTVPSNKSSGCACPAGSSAVECAKGASDEKMDECFGANRILFAKGLLLVLYLAATSAFVATAELGRLARRIPPKQAIH
jgi:hypothetical protein